MTKNIVIERPELTDADLAAISGGYYGRLITAAVSAVSGQNTGDPATSTNTQIWIRTTYGK